MRARLSVVCCRPPGSENAEVDKIWWRTTSQSEPWQFVLRCLAKASMCGAASQFPPGSSEPAESADAMISAKVWPHTDALCTDAGNQGVDAPRRPPQNKNRPLCRHPRDAFSIATGPRAFSFH